MNVHVPHRTTAAEVARSAFWSLIHPLNKAYQRDKGWTDAAGVHHPANGFSLRQLIEYAEELPPEILADYAEQYAAIPANDLAVA